MKKILTVFVAFVLLLACIPVSASAGDVPSISVGSASGLVGESVTVPIRINNNPGLICCLVSISYDPAVLTLESVDYANLFPSGSFETGGNLEVIPFNMIWLDVDAHTESGDFMYATFRINADAAPGDATISVSYDPNNTYGDVDGGDSDDVYFETYNGKISIDTWRFDSECTLYTYEGESDVNYICGVNSLDDPFMSDYLQMGEGWTYRVTDNDADAESTGAKLSILHNGAVEEEYYLVLFGDVNGDCTINGLDILMLMDMISGEWGDFIMSDEFPQTFAADLNHDGDVNGLDILCIMDCMAVDDAPFQFIDA